jgi:hypothetical protein
LRIEEPCDFGGGLFRGTCGQPATAQCVYCGHPFCDRHGEHGPDYTDACHRKRCAAKLRDVIAHQEWKERVRHANSVSVCAHEDCGNRMNHQCSRCRLQFCAEHVSQVTLVYNEVQPPRKDLALACMHCKDRRKIWSR